jgi:DNA-binding SARP family transcriptional activator
LETCDDAWCLEIREALKTTMLDLLIGEAQYLARNGALSQAEACFSRALRFDSFDERVHRGIMWCRVSSNDRTGALRQFQECARILREELAVEPSIETRNLYKTILAGSAASLPS